MLKLLSLESKFKQIFSGIRTAKQAKTKIFNNYFINKFKIMQIMKIVSLEYFFVKLVYIEQKE